MPSILNSKSDKKRIKMTLERAKERFADRKDIKLLEFVGWKKKAKFFDNIVEDYFWAIPDNVFRLKSVHPRRRREKTKQTNIIRYGVENPAQNNQVKNKTRKTNIERYGFPCSLSNKKVRDKAKQTSLKNWGEENPLASTAIKRKVKNTNLAKYNVEYPSQNPKIKEKIKKTVYEKYNVCNVAQADVVKTKYRKTCLSKYGVENSSQIKQVKQAKKQNQAKYFVLETNEIVCDWLQRQANPKPSYSFLQQLLKTTNQKYVNEQLLNEICGQYKSCKTKLEVIAEKLFETKHFNKKPKQIKYCYKPDFKLSPQIFLNVDGLYWHSEAAQQDKKYHFNLRKEFEEAGLRVFQFREDEVRDKPDIVKSIVDNALGKTKNKIFARKCELKQVKQKEASIFLRENHLMGSTNAKHLGLFYETRLVSLLSYKQRNHICKIERFCSLINTNVVGGFSKLLNYLEKNCLDPKVLEIHNWVDLRYGTGNHLLDKGFYQAKETLGWKWTDNINTYNRLKCRANMDQRKLTQQEHSIEMGWSKIYDAGQRLYIKFSSS